MTNLGGSPSLASKKIFIGVFGLSEYELRLVRSVLSLTMVHGRAHSFALADATGAHGPDIVIVDPNNEQARLALQELTSRDKSHEPFVLFISNTPQASQDAYHLLRPLAPTKMLALLDRIASEIDSILPTAQAAIAVAKVAAPVTEQAISQAHPDVCYASVKEAAGPHPLRALIVDDSPTARIKIELELRPMNILSDSAHTGEQALQMLAKKSYDLIFLDIVLPGVDGYDLCKIIRHNAATKRVPIIMLTSKSSPFDRLRGSLAGCNSYLTKPVEHVKFHAVVEKCVAESVAAQKHAHDKKHGMPMTA